MKMTRDIIIPAGTTLHPSPNERRGYYEATVGFGPDFTGYLVVQPRDDAFASGYFERHEDKEPQT